jgi:hypothetical protein
MKALLLVLLLGSVAVRAAEEEPRAAEVETEAEVPAHAARDAHAVLQVSILAPQTLTTFTERYEIRYADNISGMPSVQLGIATPLFLVSNVEAHALVQLGYGFKEGLFNFTNRISGGPARDLIRLHRLPATLGVKLLYHIPWLTFVKPSLTFGAGAHWLIQSGRLEGTRASFWIPYYFVSPALTFFESRQYNDWFGGFTFGVSYHNDLHPTQVLRAWSFDLSVNLFL